MTITGNHVSPAIEEPDLDHGPGSSDVTWAERAYHQQRREPGNERRTVPRARRRRLRLRTLVAVLAVVLLTAGLVVAMRYEGSSPSPVVHGPASSQTATAPQPVTGQLHFTLTPPLLHLSPSLSPAIDTTKR